MYNPICILIDQNIPQICQITENIIRCCSAELTINYGGTLLFDSEHQSWGGLGAGRYMTAVFTHIWFSKWIFLSLHYWSQSQYNECLPWRWHRGGLILPHFPKLAHFKILHILPYRLWSVCVCVCALCKHVHSRESVQIHHSMSGLSWSLMMVCPLQSLMSTKHFTDHFPMFTEL